MRRVFRNSRFIVFTIFILVFIQTVTGQKVSYSKDILPIFQTQCNGCHQPAKMKGDYLMTEFSSLLQGGQTGAVAVVPGYPEKSYLLNQWIKEGALDDS